MATILFSFLILLQRLECFNTSICAFNFHMIDFWCLTSAQTLGKQPNRNISITCIVWPTKPSITRWICLARILSWFVRRVYAWYFYCVNNNCRRWISSSKKQRTQSVKKRKYSEYLCFVKVNDDEDDVHCIFKQRGRSFFFFIDFISSIHLTIYSSFAFDRIKCKFVI